MKYLFWRCSIIIFLSFIIAFSTLYRKQDRFCMKLEFPQFRYFYRNNPSVLGCVYTVPDQFWSDTKCSFSLAFTLYRCSFGAVQVQNCSSFLAATKLYLIAGTKLYRITLSSVSAWLIPSTFVSDQKWSGTVYTRPYQEICIQRLHRGRLQASLW